jgi:F-type H+-transporting ATPase subunit b
MKRLALALGLAALTTTAVATADKLPESHPTVHLPSNAAVPLGAATHGGAAAHEGPSAGEGHEGDHAVSAHEGHEGHEGHGPAPINWSDFGNKKQPPYLALVINFAILLFIYYRAGKKPVADALKNRKDSIAKEIEEATRQKKEAEARAKKYQADLGNLDKDLETTKKALEEAGKAERDRLIQDAKEKAERMKRDATFLVEQEGRQAKLDLTRETVEAAIGRAESLLQSHVTQEDHDRLCAEFLQELGSKPKTAEVAS